MQVTVMETVEMKVKCSIIKLVTGKMSRIHDVVSRSKIGET